MNHPLVSIIIPAYNAVHLLEETVASALGQSYPNVEIIVVNDGSTDATTSLFADFEKEGIRCYSKKNNGASAARNYGVDKANGEYIQFLDADDLLHKDKIKRQIETLKASGALISYTLWSGFTSTIDQSQKFRFHKLPYAKERSGKELMISFGLDNWFMPVFCWLTHRSLIDKAGHWDITISNNDDGEYFSRVLYHADNVICEDAILAYYRMLESNSLSTFNSKEKIDAAYRSYQLIEKLVANDSNRKLLSYPKRMYYIQYRLIKEDFPELAKRAARSFDKIKAESFLSSNRILWVFIRVFGLYKGTELYHRTINKIKRTFK